MSNLKEKITSRQSRMDKAMGDEGMHTYEEDFDEIVTLDEMQAKKKELEKSWKKSKDGALLTKIAELDRKITTMKEKSK